MQLMTTEVTMTSKEIADLVGSRHDNVKVAIERLVEKGVITFPAVQEKATSGRPLVEYIFSGEKGKRDSIIVVAQLSPEFTARLVDRWQELEAVVAKPLPAVVDPRTQALIESLVRFDALEQAQKQLAEQQKQQAAEQKQQAAKTAEVSQRLDQIETAQNHFTVVGYANLHNITSLALANSAKIGKAASKYCKERDIETGETPDPRFGRVKTYPKYVLDIVFEDVLDLISA